MHSNTHVVYFVYSANQTRKFSAPFDTEVHMPKVNDDEYVMLKDATCMHDISKSILMHGGYFKCHETYIAIKNCFDGWYFSCFPVGLFSVYS